MTKLETARLEERLRRDLRALAQQAQPELLRELRVPRARAAWQQRRWLIPVAAAAAVAVVLGGVYAAVRSVPRRQVAAAVTPVPRYYLDNSASSGKILTVRDSAAGHILATLRAPAGYAFSSLAAAADDRTFVVTEVGGPQNHSRWEFYLLRLTPGGRPVSLSRLKYAASGNLSTYISSIAVSPDASLLAVARVSDPTRAGKATGPETITEVSLASGTAVRTWTAPGAVQFGQLSWVRHGGISYTSYDNRPLPRRPPVTQLRLLDTSRPGGDLLADSQVIRIDLAAGSTLSVAGVTPDGSKVLAWTYPLVKDRSGGGGYLVENWLGEYSARTGRLLRVLYGRPLSRTNISDVRLFSVDPSSRHILFQVEDIYGHIIFGRLDNGRFTPLPHTTSSTGEEISAW